MRNESRKGKVGNPWTCGRHRRDQRRLPDVGKPNEANIRQEAEFKLDLPRLSGQSRLGESGGTVCGGGERGIPSSAFSAVGDHDLLAGGVEVGEYFSTLSVTGNGSGWDRKDQGLCIFPMLVLAPSMLTPSRFGVMPMGEIKQCVPLRVNTQDDVSAIAAIAAVRPSPGPKLLTQKADTATPAITGFDSHGHFVNEVHSPCISEVGD